MSFRPVTLLDARLTHRWRTQAEANHWWQGTPTSYEDHLEWLQTRKPNPLIKLLIWEEDGRPAGIVRIDSNGELAFDCDDDKVAVRMVAAAGVYAEAYGGRLKATVDAADPRASLLEAAGFTTYPAVALVYKP